MSSGLTFGGILINLKNIMVYFQNYQLAIVVVVVVDVLLQISFCK